jgi:hypothetical protein
LSWGEGRCVCRDRAPKLPTQQPSPKKNKKQTRRAIGDVPRPSARGRQNGRRLDAPRRLCRRRQRGRCGLSRFFWEGGLVGAGGSKLWRKKNSILGPKRSFAHPISPTPPPRPTKTKGRVCYWDLVEAAMAASFAAHKGPVCGLAAHPQGECLVTCGVDGLVKVWRPQGG